MLTIGASDYPILGYSKNPLDVDCVERQAFADYVDVRNRVPLGSYSKTVPRAPRMPYGRLLFLDHPIPDCSRNLPDVDCVGRQAFTDYVDVLDALWHDSRTATPPTRLQAPYTRIYTAEMIYVCTIYSTECRRRSYIPRMIVYSEEDRI